MALGAAGRCVAYRVVIKVHRAGLAGPIGRTHDPVWSCLHRPSHYRPLAAHLILFTRRRRCVPHGSLKSSAPCILALAHTPPARCRFVAYRSATRCYGYPALYRGPPRLPIRLRRRVGTCPLGCSDFPAQLVMEEVARRVLTHAPGVDLWLWGAWPSRTSIRLPRIVCRAL